MISSSVASRHWARRRFVAQALALGAVCLTLAACVRTSSPPAGLPGAGARLRVGIAANYPPLAFREDGRLQGVEVDFARELERELGVEVEIVETPWDDLIPDLRGGAIDVIMSGMSITALRRQRVSFGYPYLKVGQMAIVRAGDVSRLSPPGAMNTETARVGVHRNTTGEAFAKRKLKRAKVLAYDSIDAGIEALRSGEIDYFVHDAPTVWRLTGRPTTAEPGLSGLYRPMTEEYLAWAVRRRDGQELRLHLDAALQRWKATGKLQAILDQWIPVTRVTVEVSPAR